MIELNDFITILNNSNDNTIEYIGVNYNKYGIKYLKTYYKTNEIPFSINAPIENIILSSFPIPFNYTIYYYGNSIYEKSVSFYTNDRNGEVIKNNIIRLFTFINLKDKNVYKVRSELTDNYNFEVYFPPLFTVKMVNDNIDRFSVYLKQPYERINDKMFIETLINIQSKNNEFFIKNNVFDILLKNINNKNANLFLIGIDIINNKIKYKIYLKKMNEKFGNDFLNEISKYIVGYDISLLKKLFVLKSNNFSFNILALSNNETRNLDINIYYC